MLPSEVEALDEVGEDGDPDQTESDQLEEFEGLPEDAHADQQLESWPQVLDDTQVRKRNAAAAKRDSPGHGDHPSRSRATISFRLQKDRRPLFSDSGYLSCSSAAPAAWLKDENGSFALGAPSSMFIDLDTIKFYRFSDNKNIYVMSAFATFEVRLFVNGMFGA